MEASFPTLNMQQRSQSEPYLSNFNGGRSGLGNKRLRRIKSVTFDYEQLKQANVDWMEMASDSDTFGLISRNLCFFFVF